MTPIMKGFFNPIKSKLFLNARRAKRILKNFQRKMSFEMVEKIK
jgi:hypothetical protein